MVTYVFCSTNFCWQFLNKHYWFDGEHKSKFFTYFQGFIPAENLKKILLQLPDVEEDEVDAMIAAIDDDGNGEVSFDGEISRPTSIAQQMYFFYRSVQNYTIYSAV